MKAAARRSPWALEGLRFAAGVVLVAVVAAAFAIAFRGALTLAMRYATGEQDVVTAMRRLPPWARVLTPAAGGLLAGLLGRRSARSSGGVGAVMEAVVLGRAHLSMRATLLKSLASFAAIASGGSLGREGPLIQFGGAAGQLLGGRLSLSQEHVRSLIAAGTAAGFAAAYNTPFAAVLFVLEVVTGIVVLETIVPTLISTALATALTRAVMGQGPVYGGAGIRGALAGRTRWLRPAGRAQRAGGARVHASAGPG